DALEVERWNMLNPTKKQKVAYISQILKDEEGVFVAASDYVKAIPDSISKWIPGQLTSLGTDGFGRSESREALRDFFEVDHRHIVYATLGALAKDGKVKNEILEKAKKQLKIKSDKPNPIIS
ncbi:MAG: pyruvate dehydrogenase (acetyl-transferring), homodimeric type, partial [Ignavibacteriaceae bacterium]|nr:pyruvate dehydrogenase (acetyl-transferring), homodimeric type [Ignavibacteriaceae bacterium]